MAADKNDRLLEVDEELLQDLRKLMEIGDGNALIALLIDLHEADIAELLQYLEEEERHHLLGLFSGEMVGEVILHLPEEQREEYLSRLEPQHISNIVEELSTDDAADIVAGLSDKVAEEVLQTLQLTDSEATEDIRDLLRYDENTAGGRMTTDYVAVADTETVVVSIERIREFVRDTEIDVLALYVVDMAEHLVGYVRLHDLVLRPPVTPVVEIMVTDLITVSPEEDQALVGQLMQRYDLIAVPVVSDDGVLLGIVTFDDIADIIGDETSEDMLYLAGVTDDESPSTPPLISVRRRIPWLAVNLGTAFLASMIVARFEGTIQQVATLAALLPVVGGMGGNAAIQSITVMVRSMALGELTSGRSRRVIVKEVSIGLINGITMGALAGMIVWIIYGSLALGVLTSIAMLGNLIVAGLAGSVVPLVLRRLKFDPALSSGPIVTTCTDMSGFFILLGLTTLTLSWVLGK